MISIGIDIAHRSGSHDEAVPQVPWTLDDIPAEYRTNGGLWEAHRQVVQNGFVTAWPDGWGVRDMRALPEEHYRPKAGMAGGNPAAIWPNTSNDCQLRPASLLEPAYFVFVTQYGDGVDDTFGDMGGNTAYSTLFSNGEMSYRAMGAAGSDQWYATDVASPVTSINGAEYSARALPMPLSIVEAPIVNFKSLREWSIGRPASLSGRAWRGPICMSMALGLLPPPDLRLRIQGRLAWDYGLVARLPKDHPYKERPPMRGGS